MKKHSSKQRRTKGQKQTQDPSFVLKWCDIKVQAVDDVTAMIAGQIGQLAPMDEATSDLSQKLAEKMLEQSGK